jgi:hypothetical protein
MGDKPRDKGNNTNRAQALKQKLGKLYFITDGAASPGAVMVMGVVKVRKDKIFREKGRKTQIHH